MEDGPSSRRRSWADEVEDEMDLLKEELLGRGPEGRVSLSDSEDSDYSDEVIQDLPPEEDKGKEVALPARKRHRPRRHRHRHRADGFMAAARRAHPLLSPPLGPQRRSPAHPARARGMPYREGFFQVQSKCFGRSRSPLQSPHAVPPELVGLCFKCLAKDHVKANRSFPAKSYNCWPKGHQTVDCTFPKRAAAPGGKRGRSPSTVEATCRVTRRRSPPRHRRRESVEMIFGRSASTGCSTSNPFCCAPPTPPPETPLPPPPPPSPPSSVEQPRRTLPLARGRVPASRDLCVTNPVSGVRAEHLEPRQPQAMLVVVPRTISGTRLDIGVVGIYTHLWNRFEIDANNVDIRRHQPEDFIARFRRVEDREHVLNAPLCGPPPLIWRPWRRTSLASAGAFHFKVLIALGRVPLHARYNAAL